MIELILIAIISLIAQLMLPWWSLVVVSFVICCWRNQSAGRAFMQGFGGIAIVWFLYALLIHFRTEGVLTGRMGLMFLKSAAPIGMLLLTPLLGGIVGGFAGMAGALTRQVILPLQQFRPKRA